MDAASCAGGDFSPYFRNVGRAAEALLGQAREALHGMSAAGGKRQEHAEPRRGGPWARRGGPWEGGFRWAGPGGPGGPGGGRAAPGGPASAARAAGGPARPVLPGGRRPAAAMCAPPSWPC